MDETFDFAVEENGNIVISACQAPFDEEYDNGCAYYMRIENNSDSRIYLISKEFNVTDDHGNSYCDSTFGFKGELPALEPGEYFEYEDTAPLHSSSGVLYGVCKIVAENDRRIKDVRIPALSLTGVSSANCALN